MAEYVNYETTGEHVEPGMVIIVRDRLPGGEPPADLTIMVLTTESWDGFATHIQGVAVASNRTEIYEPVVISVVVGEPVRVVARQDPDDWSADFARFAALMGELPVVVTSGPAVAVYAVTMNHTIVARIVAPLSAAYQWQVYAEPNGPIPERDHGRHIGATDSLEDAMRLVAAATLIPYLQ